MVEKYISFETLSDEACLLADLIINRYASMDGAIFEAADVQNGKVSDHDCAVDELGDYVQYIIYLGIITSKKFYVDWGLSAISSISSSYQSEKGLFFNKPK
ncbi:MAG: hypothetical protein JW882_03175, partial [Deltaproteobacteria bacterium]|nr:hypothetical protein [Deltaproteobacteria bacterium]